MSREQVEKAREAIRVAIAGLGDDDMAAVMTSRHSGSYVTAGCLRALLAASDTTKGQAGGDSPPMNVDVFSADGRFVGVVLGRGFIVKTPEPPPMIIDVPPPVTIDVNARTVARDEL